MRRRNGAANLLGLHRFPAAATQGFAARAGGEDRIDRFLAVGSLTSSRIARYTSRRQVEQNNAPGGSGAVQWGQFGMAEFGHGVNEKAIT